MLKIVVFASGSGSNAERIATYFAEKGTAQVQAILSNNPQAGVLARAKRLAIPSIVFDRQAFYHSDIVLNIVIKLMILSLQLKQQITIIHEFLS